MVELATILDDMPVGEPAPATLKAEARHLNFHYGAFHALKDISLPYSRLKR